MNRKRVLVIASLASVLAVVILFFVLRNAREEEQKVQTVAPAVQVGSVSLSREIRERAGIETANPKPYLYREETQAYVTVLDPASLIDLRKSYLDAEAGEGKSKAALDATRAEYERMKKLYGEKNVSGKAFQSAEASFRADEADNAAASEAVRTALLSADQRWGSIIAGWIKSGSGQFQRLTRREDVLLQVSLPQGYSASTAPAGLKAVLPSGKSAAVRFVSPAPRADPRIQGQSFFYVAPARETGLVPGMSVSAVFPSGQPASGLLVPGSAVVWWQGRAWAYVKAGDTFMRREVPTGQPADGGWFISRGFSQKDEIVVKGAETLLSQEFLAKPAGGTEEEED